MTDRRDFAALLEMVEDENDAFDLIHLLRAKFGMVGSEFCRADLEDMWDERFLEGVTGSPFTDDHWDICLGLRSWYRSIQEAMIEVGHQVILDVVIEEIDKEMNQE